MSKIKDNDIIEVVLRFKVNDVDGGCICCYSEGEDGDLMGLEIAYAKVLIEHAEQAFVLPTDKVQIK